MTTPLAAITRHATAMSTPSCFPTPRMSATTPRATPWTASAFTMAESERRHKVTTAQTRTTPDAISSELA
jgi:hypothetical protein